MTVKAVLLTEHFARFDVSGDRENSQVLMCARVCSYLCVRVRACQHACAPVYVCVCVRECRVNEYVRACVRVSVCACVCVCVCQCYSNRD